MSQGTPINQIHGTESQQSALNRIFGLWLLVNGGLDFGVSTQTPSQYTGNMNGQWANVTAPASPNTQFAVAHTLGRIPSFYFFISDRAANLYQLPTTGTAWTSTNIYLKCSVASAVLRIFIT